MVGLSTGMDHGVSLLEHSFWWSEISNSLVEDGPNFKGPSDGEMEKKGEEI